MFSVLVALAFTLVLVLGMFYLRPKKSSIVLPEFPEDELPGAFWEEADEGQLHSDGEPASVAAVEENLRVWDVLPEPMIQHRRHYAPYSILLPIPFLEKPARETFDIAFAELYEQQKLQAKFFDELDLEHNRAPVYFSDSWYLPLFRQAGYEIDTVSGQTLDDWLQSVPVSHYILLSVKDDGSQALTQDVLAALAPYGITQLTADSLRCSYANVIRRTEEGGVSLLERVSDTTEVLLDSRVEGELAELPVEVQVLSAGAFKGNRSSILVNGVESSNNHRGLNLVVLDATGQVVQRTHVDTFATLWEASTVYVAKRPTTPVHQHWAEQNHLVAHALGGWNNRAYSNSLEAFLHAYRQGHRVFEVDLVMTSDGHLVARHDWEPYLYDFLIQQMPEQQAGAPLTLAQFQSLPIFGYCTPLTFSDVCGLMQSYPDVVLITDTKSNDREGVLREFTVLLETAKQFDSRVLERIVPQVYNEEMWEVLSGLHSFSSYLYTLYQTHATDEDVLRFVVESGITAVAMSEQRYSHKLVDELAKLGVYTFLHTLNALHTMKEWVAKGFHGFYTDYVTPQEWKLDEVRGEALVDSLHDVISLYLSYHFPDEAVEFMERVRQVRRVDVLDRILIALFKNAKLDTIEGLLPVIV